MVDYSKCFLTAFVIAVCIGLLFIGEKVTKAKETYEQMLDEWIWPTEGIISDHFGTRGGAHKGIDIAGSLHTDIVAVCDGIVSKSYYSETYGHVVFIRHPREGFETVYAHLNRRLVQEGETIKQGKIIGEMGNTGRSRGVHLHFEVHQHSWSVEKENAINPLLVIHQKVDTKPDKQSVEVIKKQNEDIVGR